MLDFEGLKEYIQSKMQMNPGFNYQPVMIKALNQSEGTAKKEEIQEELHKANPEYPPEHFEKYPFDILEGNKVVKHNKAENSYTLLAFDTYHNNVQKTEWISMWCDEKILEANTYSKIKKLSDKGVSDKVVKALTWYWKRRGKTYSRDTLSKPNRIGAIDGELLLDDDQRLHGMVKGVYKAKGEEFPQAITLNPNSKWKMELKLEHPTIRIDYDFKDAKKYADQISWIEKTLKENLPIGVVFGLGKNKWRILGLCKIKEKVNQTTYRLEHWGITDNESKKLKDDTIRDYDRYHTIPELKKYETIDWNEFSGSETELKILPKNMSSDKKSISNILYEIDEGNWVLPGFQRFFDWNTKDVSKLLESIFNGYYVGSFLLWDVEDSKKEECETFPIEGSVPKKPDYNMIVLDGQQRVTSLNYAIRAPDISNNTRRHPGYFYMDVQGFLQGDEEEVIVRTQNKIDEKDTYDRLLFPLYYLEKPDEWINNLREFLRDQNNYSEKFEVSLFNPLRDRANRMSGFEIPIIYLKRIPFDVVSTIFENVNTRGKRLKVFDLMNNRMAGYKVRLRDLWTKAEAEYPLIKNYDEKMVTTISRYIMESISLSYSRLKSCKKADILDMYSTMQDKEGWTSEKFNQMWEDIAFYTDVALKHLEDKQKGFGVPSPDFLPYEPMIPVLTSLIQQTKENYKQNEAKCEEKIRKWYWSSVFNDRYSHGVEGRKTSDYKAMVEWFKDDEKIPKFIIDFQEDYQRIPFEDVSTANSAIYKGIMCLILKRGAIDTKSRFALDSKNHMDHIFPKSKVTSASKNSILNMTWLTDTTNISKTNKMPKDYYPEIQKKLYDDDKSKFLRVMSSHLINKKCYECMLDNDFESFIEERRKEFLRTIAGEIGTTYVDEDEVVMPTQTSKNTPFGNRLVLRTAIESCSEEILWVSKYFGSADLKTLYIVKDQLRVKKIRILTSKYRANEDLKSDFKSFKKELGDNNGIECQMRVMDKKAESEIHARYLADPDKCYNSIDTEIALRGQSDDISPCKRPANIEKWWNDSFDIFKDWNKFAGN